MARACAALFAAASIPLLPPAAASAAPPRALPMTVRVNVARLGVSYAVLSSTGSVTVTAPDGSVAYRGGARTLARTKVRRVAGEVIPERRSEGTREERHERDALRREARDAARAAGPRALVTVPFELSLLTSADDPLGVPLRSGERVIPLRFTTDDGALVFNGRAFRGTLELAIDDEGDMIVVNEVTTAEYLASVVGTEVPPTWHPEALAAQAIAARTYLLTHLGRHRTYDLEGDERDQAYDGIGGETSATVRAVQRTTGTIATYRGGAIEALYSANAGGVTEDSENVYQNALPYLRSVPSPADEIAATSSWGRTSWRWTRELTAAQLREHLAVRGIVVGEVRRVELTQVSPTGRVVRARVVGSLGTRDIGKDASRHYFGLRSTLFTVEAIGGGEIEAVDSLDGERRRTLEGLGATLLGALHRRVVDADRGIDDLRIVGHVYRLPARFVFSGRGFGHGVGMSQWGMQGMALAGASAEAILRHYYRGIALADIGGP